MGEANYTIATLARFCGVTYNCIKKWDSQRKIPKPIISAEGQKIWTADQAREVLEFRKTQTPEGRKAHLEVFPKKVEPKGRIT